VLDKLFPFELSCFALVLLQGLQLFCFVHLLSLKRSGALVVVWVERARVPAESGRDAALGPCMVSFPDCGQR